MSIVFVGAGGSGLSAIVHIMISLGIPQLVCIDSHDTPAMQDFRSQGVRTYIGHGVYTVLPDDIVIYSAATPESIEVQTAIQHALKNPLSCPPMLYFEFLGEISKYMYTIAISGTHGKSTTTGLTAATCIRHIPQTSLAILGAGVTERNGKNSRYNEEYTSELHAIISRIISRKATQLSLPRKKLVFIVEADEFNHHFLYLEPDISIITFLDHDHTDIYPTRDEYVAAFNQFCTHTKEVVFTLPSIKEELESTHTNIQTPALTHFSFGYLIGGHNHANASLALAAITYYQKTHHIPDTQAVKKSIEQFQGLQRRVELLGQNIHGVSIFSDYGHHPDEIKSTIAAFRETHPGVSITCIFEAHQSRRLLSFWDEFVHAFDNVACYVVPIYTARESIEELPTYTAHLPTSLKNQSIHSFDELARVFCIQSHATYLAERNILPDAYNTITSGAIICFTAGQLDGKMRALLSPNK